MTAVDLDALDKLREAADPAPVLPWHVDPQDAHRIATRLGGGVCSTYLPGDAALIVAAVNALPELLDAARKYRALREAVDGLAAELDQELADRGVLLDRVIRPGDRIRAALAAPLAGQHTTEPDVATELAERGLRACCGQPSERHCR